MKLHNTPRTLGLTALTVSALCLTSLSFGQTSSSSDSMTTPGSSSSTSTLSSSDRHFIEKAAKDNQQEIAVAHVAVERASDPAVKSYAQQILSDHEAAGAELATLAASKGLTLPTETKESHHVTALSKKSGMDFDKDFVDMMTSDHKDTVSLFEKASAKSDDPAVAAFASKILPKLQQHETMAKDLKASLKK